MRYGFPIKIRQSVSSILRGIYAFLGFGCIGFIVVFNAPNVGVAIFFILVFIGLGAFIYLSSFGKNLTLTEQGVVYKYPRGAVHCSYGDIQKVGYESAWGRQSRPGIGVSFVARKVTLFCKGTTIPKVVDITVFSEADQLLFLETLVNNAPRALFGDTVATIINTGNFPERLQDAGVFGSKIADTGFTRSGSTLSNW